MKKTFAFLVILFFSFSLAAAQVDVVDERNVFQKIWDFFTGKKALSPAEKTVEAAVEKIEECDESRKVSQADVNCDGVVDDLEFDDYLQKFVDGEIDIGEASVTAEKHVEFERINLGN